MSNISIFNDLLEIYNLLDDLDSLEQKFTEISKWVENQKGINRVIICNFVESPEKSAKTYLSKKELDELCPQIKPHNLCSLIPDEPGIIDCMDNSFEDFLNQSGWRGKLICVPVFSKKGKKLGAILIQGDDPAWIFETYHLECKFIAIKIRQLFEIDFLKDKLEKEDDFLDLFINQENGKIHKIFNTRSSHLINWLNLPLYIADIQGNLLYANNVFLNLLRIKDLNELNNGYKMFPDQACHTKEIEEIIANGRVDNYRLTIKRKDGQTLDIRDSALLIGSHIFGFFFDVTELVRLNSELKDALQMQEFLNDKLISSSLLLQKTQTTTVRSLARLAEYRDGETGEHLDRICSYSAVLTQEVYKKQPYNWRVCEKYIYDLIVSSMLHDIGKVGVPDSILLKPGKLNVNEFQRMKNHTILGWAILNQADTELGEQSYLTLAASIALHHHERYDGQGYPHRLEGEKIPLSARIEAIADVYDALTSKRPYKEPWSHDEAVAEIIAEQGLHFDPVLVDIFLAVEDKFYKIRNRMDN